MDTLPDAESDTLKRLSSQVGSCPLLTAVDPVGSHCRPCGIYGGQSDTETCSFTPNTSIFLSVSFHQRGGLWWHSLLRHCTTIWKAAGLILDGVIGIFNWHNLSGCTMALGSTQPLTEMSKGKAVLLQAWSGLKGSRKLRFPDFMTTALAAFTPRKYSWYSFLLEAESTPGS